MTGRARCAAIHSSSTRCARSPPTTAPVFVAAFFGHANFVCRNATRAFVLGSHDGRFARVPHDGPLRRHVQQLTRSSAALAVISTER